MEGSGIGYKRRDTDPSVDSYAQVNISVSSTFNGVDNGTYIEVDTGKTVTISNVTLTTEFLRKSVIHPLIGGKTPLKSVAFFSYILPLFFLHSENAMVHRIFL